MRDLVYYIATTLDGFIAREDGSFDDFPWTQEYLAELMTLYPETFPAPFRGGQVDRADNRRFDAVLMGRRTYEVGSEQGLTNPYPTLDQYLFSRSLEKSPDPAVHLVRENAVEKVQALKQEEGKAIWLCGGGHLATDLMEAGLVDEVALKINPILFGAGIPLLTRPLATFAFERAEHRAFDSGHLLVRYRAKGRG